LCRESNTGAEMLYKRAGILENLLKTIDNDKQLAVVLACIRVLDEFARVEKFVCRI
jgi:hypothetical protein